ncbi:MAG: DUF3793 family protein [Angelakisella sp.]|nr:DUF3793 family protein [Angelakisella sp.]
MSEQQLIYHCAPTLAGLKNGSLFSCCCKCKADALGFVRSMNRKLVPKGLRVIPLKYTYERVLIYVYRPSGLSFDLSCKDAQLLLKEAGYQACSTEKCIMELIHRMQMQEEFPHEIGLFLSYPPEDVRGFIENKGAGCKCVGCWKVYGNAQKAMQTFEQYKKCQATYCLQWQKGIKIERLAVAV